MTAGAAAGGCQARRTRPIRSACRSLGKRWGRDLRPLRAPRRRVGGVPCERPQPCAGSAACWTTASSPSETRHSAGDQDAAGEHLPVVLRAEAGDDDRAEAATADERRERDGGEHLHGRGADARRRSAGPRAGPRPPTGCAAPDIPTPRAASRTSASTSPRPGHGVGEQRRDREHRAREHRRGVAEQAARGEQGEQRERRQGARRVGDDDAGGRAPAAVTEPEARRQRDDGGQQRPPGTTRRCGRASGR